MPIFVAACYIGLGTGRRGHLHGLVLDGLLVVLILLVAFAMTYASTWGERLVLPGYGQDLVVMAGLVLCECLIGSYLGARARQLATSWWYGWAAPR